MSGLEIALSNGLFAVVSECDYKKVAPYKWRAYKRGNSFYVETKILGKTVLMHRLILECEKGVQVDHVDGNGLNNTRGNIRLCSNSQNQQNRGKFRNNKSGYCGVYHDSRKKSPWRAEINVSRKRLFVGYFSTPEEAAAAYNRAAIELHGSFARLNQL